MWTYLVSCFVPDKMAATAIHSLTIDIVRKVVSFLGSAAQWWIGDQYSPGWRFIGLSASVPQSPSFDSYQAHNAPLLGDNSSAKRVEQCVWRNENLGGIALVTSWSVFASCRAELRLFTRDREQLIPSSATCGESPQSCRICSALPSCLWQGGTPGRRRGQLKNTLYMMLTCVFVCMFQKIYICVFTVHFKAEDWRSKSGSVRCWRRDEQGRRGGY